MAKILLADDDEAVLHLVRRLLKSLGHEVTSTQNGLDALKLGMSGEFDLYVLDVRMPRLDGYSLCRSITQKHPSKKVVLITGLDVNKYESMAKACGAAATIAKPFDVARFRQEIERLLA